MIARRLGIKQEGGIETQVVGKSIMLPFGAQLYFMGVDRASMNNDDMYGNNFLKINGKLFVRSSGKLPAEDVNNFRGADNRNDAAGRQDKAFFTADDHRQRRQHKNRRADQNQHQYSEQRFIEDFLHL